MESIHYDDNPLRGADQAHAINCEISRLIEAPRFSLVRFRDVRLATSSAYLVKGIIPREGLTVVWGPPKCGKSFFVFDLLMHVALDWSYRGRKVTKAPVVYVACEGERGLGARIAAYRRKHSVDEADFFLVTTRLDLVGERNELIGAIRAQIGDVDPGAIAIDTLNRSIAGSESSDEDMGNYVKAADAVREAFKCVVIVVHHCGLDDKRPRGHTSLTGAADAQIAVKRDGDELVTAIVEYMKDGAAGDAISFRLQQVAVGTDEDGDPITSCVVVPSDDTPETRGPKLTATERRCLDALNNALVDHGETRPGDRNIPNVSVVKLATWKEYSSKAGVTEGATSKDSSRTMFARYRKALMDKGVVREWEGLVWVCATDRNQAKQS
jgi:hypothetical protein